MADPATEAVEALASYSFPGNVRELENLLERKIVLAPTAGPIASVEIPARETIGGDGTERLPLEGGFRRLAERFEEMELGLLRRAMEAWSGLSHEEIARRLGTTRRVLEARLRKLGH